MWLFLAACSSSQVDRPSPTTGCAPEDGDGDSYGGPEVCPGDPPGPDCDDTDPAIHLGAPERCNGRDDDCDGRVDEDLPGLLPFGGAAVYPDADVDGYGDDSRPIVACQPLPGTTTTVTGDCDDDDRDVNPGMYEVCDLVDDDCDGLVDEGLEAGFGSPTTWRDADGDGGGDPAIWSADCHAPGQGWIQNFDDCDDTDPALTGATCPATTVRPWDLATGGVLVTDSGSFGITDFYAPGDLDGDGRDDLVLALSERGDVLSGVDGPIDADGASTRVEGRYVFAGAASVGDVNGDGVGDAAFVFSELAAVFLGPFPLGDVAIEDGALTVAPTRPNSFYSGGPAGDGRFWVASMYGVTVIDATGTGAIDTDAGLAEITAEYIQPATADLDGDGWLELLVGAPMYRHDSQWSGALMVVPLDRTGTAPAEDAATTLLYGDGSGLVGLEVAVGADVDGDGLDDGLVSDGLRALLVCAPPAGDASLVPAADALIYPEATRYGWSDYQPLISLPGDLDGDGFGEIAVSVVPADGLPRGEVAVLPGPVRGTIDTSTAAAWVDGVESPSFLHAGDFDGDGAPSLAVLRPTGVYLVGPPF